MHCSSQYLKEVRLALILVSPVIGGSCECRKSLNESTKHPTANQWRGTYHNLSLKPTDSSEKGLWVSSLPNWKRSCLNWHQYEFVKAQKILNIGKPASLSQRERWIHRVALATAEGTCVLGTAEAKCVMGKSQRIQPRTRICKLMQN